MMSPSRRHWLAIFWPSAIIKLSQRSAAPSAKPGRMLQQKKESSFVLVLDLSLKPRNESLPAMRRALYFFYDSRWGVGRREQCSI